MAESAPFVSLESQEDMWDEDTDDLGTTLQPGKIHYRNPTFHCTRMRIGVCLLITALVIWVVTLSVLVAQKKDTKRDSTHALCLTPECVTTSYEVMSAMNFSADPCDDFYNYACGGWERENEIPDAESLWGQFDILVLENDNILKKILNDPKRKMQYKDNVAMRKTFRYYETCMNRGRINSLGAKPLLDLIAAYSSWNLSGSWNPSSWDLTTAMVDMHRNLSVFPFFSMYTGADYFNSTINVIKIDQSGLELSRDNYLKNGTDYETIRNAYKKLMVSAVKLLGIEGDVERQMMAVYELEKEIAKITIPISERRNIEEHYKKMSVKALADYTGDAINWKTFLQRIFHPFGYEITDDSIVVVYALEYLKNVSTLIKRSPKAVVANYMMWKVIDDYMGKLSDDFKKVIQEFKKAKSGIIAEEPQWRQCLSATAKAFGMPLGLLYINEKFSEESKEKIEELIKEIRNVFISNLATVDWMDPNTKERAKNKARAILENIGYPNYLTNNTQLEKKYEGLDPSEDYFDNDLKKAAFAMKTYYEKIKKPVNNKEWDMDPQVVNAYYSTTKNKIVFPAGILQAPFYNKDRPRALNYGGIGAVVGHELTHGFDDNGRRFNKYGNLIKWWSNKSIEAFKNKTKCLIDQYSNYTFFGKNVKGQQTVGENIADNGGVKQAYQAYQKHVKQHGEERLLPGLNATNDQLFFLGFSQVWCGKFRRQAALHQIENGVHTPGKYRVIGTLSNSEYFAKAFKCAPGAKMNPVKKCGIW